MDTDESGAVTVAGHIRVRDRDTGRVLLDQRDAPAPRPLSYVGDAPEDGDEGLAEESKGGQGA